MGKKNEDLLNQAKYESANTFNQPCPHAWDKDKLYQYFIQHFLTVFFFLGYFLTSFVKNNAVYILFILLIVKSVFNSHKSISYQTFVSCYENRNIGKYQAITPDNVLCVMFTNISQYNICINGQPAYIQFYFERSNFILAGQNLIFTRQVSFILINQDLYSYFSFSQIEI